MRTTSPEGGFSLVFNWRSTPTSAHWASPRVPACVPLISIPAHHVSLLTSPTATSRWSAGCLAATAGRTVLPSRPAAGEHARRSDPIASSGSFSRAQLESFGSSGASCHRAPPPVAGRTSMVGSTSGSAAPPSRARPPAEPCLQPWSAAGPELPT